MVAATDHDLEYWIMYAKIACALTPFDLSQKAFDERPETDWNRFTRIASNHLVLNAVDANCLPDIPQELRDYIAHLNEAASGRTAAHLDAAEALNRSWLDHGITPVWLKGVASLACGLYASPGERILSDIDVLVRDDQVELAKRLAGELGYSQIAGVPLEKPSHHIPRLQNDEKAVSLEIHFRVVPFGRGLPTSLAWSNVTTSRWRGSDFHTLSPTLKLVHNVIHLQRSRNRSNLRQIREFSLMVHRYHDDIDFQAVERHCSKFGLLRDYADQAGLAEAYFGVPPIMSAGVRELARRRMPHNLKFYYRCSSARSRLERWRREMDRARDKFANDPIAVMRRLLSKQSRARAWRRFVDGQG